MRRRSHGRARSFVFGREDELVFIPKRVIRRRSKRVPEADPPLWKTKRRSHRTVCPGCSLNPAPSIRHRGSSRNEFTPRPSLTITIKTARTPNRTISNKLADTSFQFSANAADGEATVLNVLFLFWLTTNLLKMLKDFTSQSHLSNEFLHALWSTSKQCYSLCLRGQSYLPY